MHQSCPGKYWRKVMAVPAMHSKVYKNDWGPILPSVAQASLVSKKFIMWHSGYAANFEMVHFQKHKQNGLLMTISM